jgi:ADP-heptose:LPS heptosyltransferase/tetratricopeptide (TPR) repeat protein
MIIRTKKISKNEAPTRQQCEEFMSAGDFNSAVNLYSKLIAASEPDAQLITMYGHALKGQRHFRSALAAYRTARAMDRNADIEMQIGHLLKDSANYRASAVFYAHAAKLGDIEADGELKHVSSIEPPSSDQANGLVHSTEAEAFAILASCNSGDVLPERLVLAASALVGAGHCAAAAGFLRLAAIRKSCGAADSPDSMTILRLFRQIEFSDPAEAAGLQSLWQSQSEHGRPFVSRQDLVVLSHDEGLANQIARIPLSSEVRVRPQTELIVADAAEAELRLAALLKALRAVAGTLQTAAAFDWPAWAAAMDDLEGALLPAGQIVQLSDSEPPSLAITACQTLNDCAWIFIQQMREACFHAKGLCGLVDWRRVFSADPLILRRRETASWDEVLIELGISDRADSAASPALDRLVASLCLFTAPAISLEEADDLLSALSRHPLPVSCRIVAEKLLLFPVSSTRLVSIAQRLKDGGCKAQAFRLLEEAINLGDETEALLLEAALLAKSMGRFAFSATILRKLALSRPDDVFIRQELAQILPEVATPQEILREFESDILFQEVAANSWIFRNAAHRGAEETGLNLLPPFVDVRAFAPELDPDLARERRDVDRSEFIELLQCGRRRLDLPLRSVGELAAFDAVRGRIASRTEIENVRVRIDGRTVGEAKPLLSGSDPHDPDLMIYYFNVWIDCHHCQLGLNELQVLCEESRGGYRSTEHLVWIDLGKNPLVVPPLNDEKDEIAGLVKTKTVSVNRPFFQGNIANLLFLRTDQLGDLIASLPAMALLKSACPGAQIVSLVAPSNVELMKTSGIADVVLSIETQYDAEARQRFVTLAEQVRIAKLLRPYAFDLAVDFSPGQSSRPILKLAQARYTAGFGFGEFRWLSLGLDLGTRDGEIGAEGLPHSAKPMALAEAIRAALQPRPDLRPQAKETAPIPLGWEKFAASRYAVLHTGARTVSRKWPLERYAELAERLVRKNGFNVVLFLDGDEASAPISIADELAEHIRIVRGHLSFQDFDAIISRAALFVGNDSGPKHLADWRRVPVVSIQMGAVPWREWGQAMGGVVLYRNVPCQGCGIEAIAECGRGLSCLLDISVDDAYAAAIGLTENNRTSNRIEIASLHGEVTKIAS